MALVKKSELSGRLAPRGVPGPTPTVAPTGGEVISKRREQNRSRARQEKAAERIGAATEQLAAGISEAAAASEELGRSLEQIAQATEVASSAAQQSQSTVVGLTPIFAQAKDRATVSRQKTGELQTSLNEVARQIGELAGAVQDNAGRQLRSVSLIEQLEGLATQVAEITETVGDVADQTNLLALNAAIEAARAGEHGRGFSIVADEVRAFATAAEKNAKDIKTVATAITSHVLEVAGRIKTAATLAANEAGRANEIIAELSRAREDMKSIAQGADTVYEFVGQSDTAAREVQKSSETIAAAAEEQSAAAEQARKAVDQQTTSLEQSQLTAQSLAQLAEALRTEAGVELSAEQVASSAEELSATVQELSGAATEILAAVDQISRGSELQAGAAQESVAALTQIEKGATAVSSAAAQSVEKGTALATLLKANQQAVAKIIEGVLSASEETESVTESMTSLEASGRQIEKTAEAIGLVAVQINMLAVSGSIEAARAGEFGRGFVVVATDIRKLAQETADNADRAKDLIRQIRDQIGGVRRDLEQIAALSRGEARRNQSIIDKLSTVEEDMTVIRSGFADISKGAESSGVAVREVLKGAQDISRGAEETNAASTQAASAAKEQAKGAEELAAAIEEIASLADELQLTKA
jgi:methyl-accepting chemotaxis protein